MKKKILAMIIGLGLSVPAAAQVQQPFWAYDDSNNETQIPAECDGVFDESRGGVFLPTAAEMFARGEDFLLDADPANRSKAGYCLIGAALLGNIDAQYRVAQLYTKGIVLPQDDLSGYRWAFLASLNGNQEAGALALLLERFLTAEEIEEATASISAMLPTVSAANQEKLDAQQERVEAKQAELDAINDEIDKMLGIYQPPKQDEAAAGEPGKITGTIARADTPAAIPAQEQAVSKRIRTIAKKAVPKGAIFTEADR